MEDQILDDSNHEGLEVDSRVEGALNSTSKWAKFLGISILIFAAFYTLMIGITVINGGLMYTGDVSYMPLVMSIFFLMIFLFLYIMIFVFLNKFSNRMKSAFIEGQQGDLVEGFINLKKLFKLVGIITIIGLVFLVFALFARIFMVVV